VEEEWIDIPRCDGYYASSLGRVKSNNTILSPGIVNGGYGVVNVIEDGKVKLRLVHRLVAQAFIPNPDNKPYVNHINSKPTDNRVINLEWCTQKENIRHAMNSGRFKVAPERIILQIKNGIVLRSFNGLDEVEQAGFDRRAVYGIITNSGYRKTHKEFSWELKTKQQ
jgi:hypothetical protein